MAKMKLNPVTGQLDLVADSVAAPEVLVASFDLTVDAAFIDFRNLIDNTSKLWRVVLIGVAVSVNGSQLRLQGYFGDVLNTSANHTYAVMGKNGAGAMSEVGGNDTTFIGTNITASSAGLGNVAGEFGYQDFEIFEPGAVKDTQFQGRTHYNSGVVAEPTVVNWFGGAIRNALAMDGLRIHVDTGNITAGKAYLLKNALIT